MKRVVKEKTSQGTGDLIEKRVSHVRNKANRKIPPTTKELVSQLNLVKVEQERVLNKKGNEKMK